MGQHDVVQASMDIEVRALSTTEVEVKWKDLDKVDRDDVLTVLEARKVYEKGKGWLDVPNFLGTDYAELPGTLHEDTFEAKTAKFFNMVAAEYQNYDYAFKQGVLPQQEWVPLNHRLVGGRRSQDLVLVEKGASGSSIIEWKDLISMCEIKYEDSKSLVDDAYLQLGDKANFVFNAQLDRSWNIYTKPLDLYAHPTLLSSFLSFLADAPVHSLGIDTHTWLQGPSTLVPTMRWDDRVPASDRANWLFQIGILGKGTRVFAVKGLDNIIHKVIKDCWDPVEQQNDVAIHRKLQEHEPQKRREAEDLKDNKLAETWDGSYNKLPLEWVKGHSDHVNLKGLTVMECSMQPQLPLWEGPWESGLAAESELVPETVTRILQGFMSKDDVDWYHKSIYVIQGNPL
ncbi:hypothetical protein F4604DRAFT_1919312 [Suillus subluteus]|nr:hypothetical protein F4604DRAFT_1919312 [Suillus subluteus]